MVTLEIALFLVLFFAVGVLWIVLRHQMVVIDSLSKWLAHIEELIKENKVEKEK